MNCVRGKSLRSISTRVACTGDFNINCLCFLCLYCNFVMNVMNVDFYVFSFVCLMGYLL